MKHTFKKSPPFFYGTQEKYGLFLRKAFAVCAVFLLLFSVAFPFIASFKTVKNYLYATQEKSIPHVSFQPVYDTTASLGYMKPKVIAYRAKANSVFDANKNVFYLKIPKTFTANAEDDLKVIVSVNGKTTEATLDLDENDRVYEDSYYTTPIMLPASKNIAYTIETKVNPAMLQNMTLVGLDTISAKTTVAFDSAQAFADSDANAVQ